MKNQQQQTKILTTCALLLAVHVVLGDYLSISTPLLKTNFGFIPLILLGILYGPYITMGVSLLGDVIGNILIPQATTPFWGFTITAALVGLTYGTILHSKTKKIEGKALRIRAALCALMINGVLYAGLNSIWLGMSLGVDAVIPMMPARLLSNGILFWVQFATIPVIFSLKDRLVRHNLVVTLDHTAL